MSNELRKEDHIDTRPVLKEVGKSLADQLGTYERVRSELRDRVRRQSLVIIEEHDREWAKVKAEFDRKISEEIAKLEAGRYAAQRALIDIYEQRKTEIESLLLRIDE